MLALVPEGGEPDRALRLSAVATAIARHFEHGDTMTPQTIKRLMRQTFGGSDADGAWSMRDAYDALETAQVLALRRKDWPCDAGAAPEEVFGRLRHFERALPTQSYRSEGQVEMQQFSTPISLAWLAGMAAAIEADDCVLEPSAGTGMLAIHAKRANAALTLNERDVGRADLLTQTFGQAVSRHDGEHIDDLLPSDVRPTVALINPPFSRSEMRGRDRHASARHLRSALERLEPGGRCIAIMPPSFMAEGAGAAGYASVAEVALPRVEITIRGNPYAKHGTSIAVRLIVFDKGWVGKPDRHVVETIEKALPIVLGLPHRLRPDDQPPPAAPLARPPLARNMPRSGGLLGGAAIRRLARPAPAPAIETQVPQLSYALLDEPRPGGQAAGIYAPWRLARFDIPGAKPHPNALVESLAMASVLPPLVGYRPRLPSRTVMALSEAQLETVILAGAAFERDLPGKFCRNRAGDQLEEHADGQAYRMGFFIGDGTGVGKGREAAACIMDRWCRGQRRHVWISKSAELIEDARRDWTALGGVGVDIQGLDAFPIGAAIPMTSGILFVTYATLRSSRGAHASRLQQILAFLGDDFEGVIAFDEAHCMANAAGTESEFGHAKGSEQGLAGVRLQNAVPRACILYVSATGATDPANLCYAARLGLWGPGTAFDNRPGFLAAMEAGGIAAMEVIARDLKAMGRYIARSLSFAGVEYEPLVHRLTPEQVTIYDAYADAWAIIHRGLDQALKASGVIDRVDGGTLNAQAKGAALSRFESAKQRFFSQILIGMKMPSVIAAIEREVDMGHSVVIQLVTTAEAVLDRRLASLSPDERANLDLDLSPRDAMIDYLKGAFPTRQMRVFRDSGGTMRSEPMIDADGNAVLCQAAIRARDRLIEDLCGMAAVPAALDELVRHFGPDRLAEVTGRSRRIVVDASGRQRIERRGSRANLADTDAFMAARKYILAFSDAGGTGRSYDSDRTTKSADRRRVHMVLEPGWRAASAVQGVGRSHRANQKTPPIFQPVTTDCRGELRFISTIVRRLDALGALTRGQRQAGTQNLFNPADNLESEMARESLSQWYRLLQQGKLASVSLRDFEQMTGLSLTEDSGALREQLPPIQRWLNRILALRIGVQNAIFEEYLGLIEARVDAARAAGTLDVGVETIQADRVVVLDDHLLRSDPETGAETRLQRLELHIRPRARTFDDLMNMEGRADDIAFLQNRKSSRVALRVPSWSITDEDGRPIPMCRLVRPTGSDRIAVSKLRLSHWHTIPEADFRALWEAEAEAARSELYREDIAIATGLLLPVWDKLPDDTVRVRRIVDAHGYSLLGRVVPTYALSRLAEKFGVEAMSRLSVDDTIACARSGEGAPLPALGTASLHRTMVNGGWRLEIRGYPQEKREWLKSLGCFTEIIQYRTRLFVPVDRAATILGSLG
ncbi:strawberry notch-like NTP hydrolase domain-containing protein [Sphingomonas sp. 1185]|uniref:strawberry notch-like NTP hydrolase domain-containing protein n=1 Tax=Sphingomonas sp. 1185 TaxID=3156411 RepID=UPI0033947ADD